MKAILHKAYTVGIVMLALFSVAMVLLDFGSVINLELMPWYAVDHVILVIFAIDYFVRLGLAKDKKAFFKQNIPDLIAIIPFTDILSLLRITRVLRIARASELLKLTRGLRLLRALGFIGILRRRAHDFLHTNGFIYCLGMTGGLIVCSSVAISCLEGKNFGDALWWSIVTTTTVGYGDISPSTLPGRIIAVILMIFGIGLISMLTGTITTYFANRSKERSKNTATENDCRELLEIAKVLEPDQLEKLTDIAKIIKGDGMPSNP